MIEDVPGADETASSEKTILMHKKPNTVI